MFKCHSVVILVGPSRSGKSYLCNQLSRLYRELYPNLNFPIISSDAIRERLTGGADKFSDVAFSSSHHSFELLEAELKALISYPQSLRNVIVFVDTRGLNETFRQSIINIAKTYNYNPALLVMDYKDRDDYLLHMDDITLANGGSIKQFILNDVQNLRTKFKPTSSSKIYTGGIHNVTKPYPTDEELRSLICKDTHIWSHNGSFLPKGNHKYLMVGDVHGRATALIDLVDPWLSEDSNNRVILVGDIMDKHRSEEDLGRTIEYIHNHMDRIYMIMGNHDYMTLQMLYEPDKDYKGQVKYYNSAPYLMANERHRHMFVSICYEARYYLIHDNFIVTHGPCHPNEIANRNMITAQMYGHKRLPNKSQEDYLDRTRVGLADLYKDYQSCWPKYIYGHISSQRVIVHKGTYGIDTGAGDNHRLTGLVIHPNRTEFRAVTIDDSVELPNLNSVVDKSIAPIDLDPKTLKRIERMREQGLRFLSGTMAPANSSDTELESFHEVLKYYRSLSVDQVVIQKKDMGSRAQCYIRRVSNDSPMVSE